jgi:hypothetical protein
MRATARAFTFGFADQPDCGLGNMLVPWARCFLWCRKTGATMLAPFWAGPAARRGRNVGRPRRDDYRAFFSDAGYVAGWRRALALRLLPGVEEDGLPPAAAPAGPRIVLFRGLAGVEPLLGRSAEILEELLRITRFPHRPPGEQGPPFVALHVRRGDFGEAPEERLRSGEPNLRQPLDWYVAALREVRRSLAAEVPAVVFSDGTAEELAPLLAEGSTCRSRGESALTDLLLMTGAAALVASRSTFSIWGSFLGQVPTLYFPGARPCPLSLVTASDPFTLEPEWESGRELTRPFLDAVAARRAAR